MHRLRVLVLVAAAVLAAAACTRRTPPGDAALLDLDAPTLEQRLREGRISSERLTNAVLHRIAALDDQGPALHAVIEVNPDALAIARELDRRLAEQGPVGPLHGMPVLLKANIDTGDRMATSAGSLALADHHAPTDAVVAARLRAAGAVIVGKANLTEWANFRSTRAVAGWSSIGGQTRNPYALDRSPCGSSSGSAVAVAARLVPLAVGTETDGSIVCPAGMNGVVGIKPTLGLVSNRGVVPVSEVQDTPGPLATTVGGAAMLLAAMEWPPRAPGAAAEEPGGAGAGPSGAGPASVDEAGPSGGEEDTRADAVGDGHDDPGGVRLGQLSDRADLAGVRLGVVRDYAGAGESPEVEGAFARALDALGATGAELVDPIELDLPQGFGAAELETLLYEFKAGIDAYLAAENARPASLAGLIDFDSAHAGQVMAAFGQDLFLAAESRGGLDAPEYRAAVAASRGALSERLTALFEGQQLDALVAPVNAPAPPIGGERTDAAQVSSSSIAAVSGYPSVAVPAGLIHGLPVGIAFIGRPDGEAELLRIAAVFERVRGPVPLPSFPAHPPARRAR